MGLTIILEDETGNAIHTLKDEFDYDHLENIDLDDFILMKYIDFYGDTTFNCLQFDDLTEDFEKLKLKNQYEDKIINEIINLINKAKEEVHQYIKFYGD